MDNLIELLWVESLFSTKHLNIEVFRSIVFA